MKYKRIVLKLSGEALKGEKSAGIDRNQLIHYKEEITAAYQTGAQLAIVIGGGNFWRGKEANTLGIQPAEAHHMGMLATVINGIALRDALRQQGIPILLMSSIPIPSLSIPYHRIQAIQALKNNKIVLLTGGLGAAFFSTDTAAITHALSLQADILLKGTKVGGVYPKDPIQYPDGVPYTNLTLSEVHEKNLPVMDMTAVTLAAENHLSIIVYNAYEKGHLTRIIRGEKLGTQLH